MVTMNQRVNLVWLSSLQELMWDPSILSSLLYLSRNEGWCLCYPFLSLYLWHKWLKNYIPKGKEVFQLKTIFCILYYAPHYFSSIFIIFIIWNNQKIQFFHTILFLLIFFLLQPNKASEISTIKFFYSINSILVLRLAFSKNMTNEILINDRTFVIFVLLFM